MTTKTFASAFAILVASHASAQSSSWTSTDVGAVTLAGSASESNGVWTVNGDGSDIWGTADSFQFLSNGMTTGNLTVRVLDLQNTSPFAKAGLMFRSDRATDAATFLIDVKPDGGVELPARNTKGASTSYLGGTTVTLPAWFRLEHTLNGGTNAWVSQNGSDWQLLREEVPVQLGSEFLAGIAVTSHDPGQLNAAHFDHLNLDTLEGGFFVTAVGDAKPGDGFGSSEWTLIGSGSDIWGTADSFQFAYHDTHMPDGHIVARVDDLQNTNAFAKAGVMPRSSLDPSAPMVILDLKPDGTIEFMARSTWAGEVSFLAGLFPPPALRWLDLSWQRTSDGTKAMVTATASADRVNWVSLGPPALIPWSYLLEAGLAVTSHDPGVRNTAHFSGVSLLSGGIVSDDIGVTGFIGGAVEGEYNARNDAATVVVGAGSDIWGTADSFEFMHGAADTTGNVHSMSSRVSNLSPTNPFAKAGMMFRDSLDPGAMHVILDVKPDGGIEFMARTCTGCEMTFLGGATMTLPVYLTLFRDGTTYTASVLSGDLTTQVTIGSVDVTMPSPIPGLAVTSHNPNNAVAAIFDNPPR